MISDALKHAAIMADKYATHPDEVRGYGGIEGYFKQRAREILHALTNDQAAKMRMSNELPMIESALQAAFDLGVESVKPPRIDTDPPRPDSFDKAKEHRLQERWMKDMVEHRKPKASVSIDGLLKHGIAMEAKYAQQADIPSLLKRALNTAIGNTGGVYSQFHSEVQQIGNGWKITATFTPNLLPAVENKIGNSFYQYVNNQPEFGSVELVINRNK